MKNKLVSLYDLCKLCGNSTLSEKYVRYVGGLDKERQYRHVEIESIKVLLDTLNVDAAHLDGFIYSYSVPQLNKEFDLLKISKEICVNIEIKSHDVSAEKIKKQLVQNKHYLKMLNKSKLFLFTFVSETKTIYFLDDEVLKETSFDILESILMEIDFEHVDLDEVYKPSNVLVSPLNDTERFLAGNYLLTENQDSIKKSILSYFQSNVEARFVGITGGPGTGKTLLVYDIACTLAEKYNILIIHSGLLCEGHNKLNYSVANIKIIPARDLKYKEIKNVDIVIVDEAHRLYESILEKIRNWAIKSKTACIFSFDAGQRLSRLENRRNTVETITKLCSDYIGKLTNKIRTNRELARFITCLFDLSKYQRYESFPNVKLIYEHDKMKALELARFMNVYGYTYIAYTPSVVNHSLDYQNSNHNTHRVIGQEFDGVCMILGDNFYYDGNILKGKTHPNPDYIFEKLLYQGLTRVRSKIALIVTEERLLDKIITLFEIDNLSV